MSAKARGRIGNLKKLIMYQFRKNIFLECFTFHIYMYIKPKIQFTVPQHKWFLLILLIFTRIIWFLIISAYSSQLQRFCISKRNGSLLTRHSDFKGISSICKDTFLKSEPFPVKIIPRVQVTLGLHTFQRVLLLVMVWKGSVQNHDHTINVYHIIVHHP